jgi:hypothetical protein
VRFSAFPQSINLHASDTQNLDLDTFYLVSSLPGSVRVEGIDAGETTFKAIIKTQDNYIAHDHLKIKVIRLNLMALDPAPSSDQHEICHLHKLIIPVNDNDSDSDGIIDFLDPEIPGGDPELAKIRLEKPAGAVASDISGNITVTFPANMNAFLNQDRTGGPAPVSYPFSELPKDIYLEGATPSSDILDSKVKAEMTLNSGVKCHDEIWYTVLQVKVKNPIDSDSDNNIDDDATSANSYTGNEFTFSPADPGVLTMPCRVEIKPDVAAVRDMFEDKIRIRLSAIGTSHDPMGPYITELSWDHAFSGETTAGNATYDGWNLWIATATFTGLPMDNSDFGEKSSCVTVFKPTGVGVLYEPEEVPYEVFWPLVEDPAGARVDGNFAKNHWGDDLAASASDTGQNRPASTRAPNWFYYWRQVVPEAQYALYDSTDPAAYGEAPAIYSFARTGSGGPYADPHNRTLIEPLAQGGPLLGVTTGIDAFKDTAVHEEYHAITQSVGYTNTAWSLGITGSSNVADSHWSFNINKPSPPPTPPLPSGRVYNHYDDINSDGDFLDAGEDLDTDGDGVINSAEPGTVESLAYAVMPQNENGLAGDDWGNPGKNHNTISYND